MPSPQFYHWANAKPVTTNQTYGFYLREPTVNREAMDREARQREYNEGFQNHKLTRSCTLPAISLPRGSTREKVKSGPKNRFNINEGYVMGPQPISERRGFSAKNRGAIYLSQGSAPKTMINVAPDMLDSRFHRSQSAMPMGKGTRDLYLWHSLSGCLVHVNASVQ